METRQEARAWRLLSRTLQRDIEADLRRQRIRSGVVRSTLVAILLGVGACSGILFERADPVTATAGERTIVLPSSHVIAFPAPGFYVVTCYFEHDDRTWVTTIPHNEEPATLPLTVQVPVPEAQSFCEFDAVDPPHQESL